MISFQIPARHPWPIFPNVSIVRGDLIHPVVSGNKLYKLQPLLKKALDSGASTLISVGGRYSNHLHALSWMANETGMTSIGLIRGYPEQGITETLNDCVRWGMKLHFVSHADYKHRYSADFWDPWLRQYPNSFRIDEGGWSPDSIEGARQWWLSIPSETTMVLCAIGSGGTYAGLVKSAPKGVTVFGIPAFLDSLGYPELKEKLCGAGVPPEKIQIWHEHVAVGFGKLSAEQKHFKKDFEQSTGIPLDPVYNTKVLYSLAKQIQNNPSLQLEKIVVIHTGGLQGNRGC